MNALVTGSQKYGTPSADSDADLVVLVSRDDLELLRKLSETPRGVAGEDAKSPSDAGPCGVALSVRFGRLNLIMVTDPIQYEVWRRGTAELERHAPVTRERAVKLFARLRRHHGLYDEPPRVGDE